MTRDEIRRSARRAWGRLRGGELTPRRAALSVGIGIAIGCLPLYGVHWLLVLAVCLPLRLDAPVAYLAANISNPFIAPFLLLSEVQLGSLVLTGRALPLTAESLAERGISGVALETVVGTAIFAPALAITLALLTFVLVALVRRRRERAHES